MLVADKYNKRGYGFYESLEKFETMSHWYLRCITTAKLCIEIFEHYVRPKNIVPHRSGCTATKCPASANRQEVLWKTHLAGRNIVHTQCFETEKDCYTPLCVKYQSGSAVTTSDAYRILIMGRTVNSLRGACIVSASNGNMEYWKVENDECEREYRF